MAEHGTCISSISHPVLKSGHRNRVIFASYPAMDQHSGVWGQSKMTLLIDTQTWVLKSYMFICFTPDFTLQNWCCSSLPCLVTRCHQWVALTADFRQPGSIFQVADHGDDIPGALFQAAAGVVQQRDVLGSPDSEDDFLTMTMTILSNTRAQGCPICQNHQNISTSTFPKLSPGLQAGGFPQAGCGFPHINFPSL